MSAYPSYEAYEAEVGTTFSCVEAGVDLKLDAVGGRSEAGGFERSTLEFSGPTSPRLPQATYTLGHPVLDEHPVFLCPVAANDERVVYEAVFSVAREPRD